MNILNGQPETFKTMSVEVEMKSLDRSVRKTTNAFTTEKTHRKLRGNRLDKVWEQVATPCE